MDQIGGRRPAAHPETLEGLTHVPLDRADAQAEIPGDLRIAAAGRGQADHLGLAAGQAEAGEVLAGGTGRVLGDVEDVPIAGPHGLEPAQRPAGARPPRRPEARSAGGLPRRRGCATNRRPAVASRPPTWPGNQRERSAAAAGVGSSAVPVRLKTTRPASRSLREVLDDAHEPADLLVGHRVAVGLEDVRAQQVGDGAVATREADAVTVDRDANENIRCRNGERQLILGRESLESSRYSVLAWNWSMDQKSEMARGRPSFVLRVWAMTGWPARARANASSMPGQRSISGTLTASMVPGRS